ncbi:MAG: hypothetical protein AAGA48_09940 [Myxococcota bacterium]
MRILHVVVPFAALVVGCDDYQESVALGGGFFSVHSHTIATNRSVDGAQTEIQWRAATDTACDELAPDLEVDANLTFDGSIEDLTTQGRLVVFGEVPGFDGVPALEGTADVVVRCDGRRCPPPDLGPWVGTLRLLEDLRADISVWVPDAPRGRESSINMRTPLNEDDAAACSAP